MKETKELVPIAPVQAPAETPRVVLPEAVLRSNIPLIALAYSLGVVGLGINAWFAWNRGSTLPDKVLLSCLGFISEAVMFFLLSQAKSLWVQRQRASFVIAWAPSRGW